MSSNGEAKINVDSIGENVDPSFSIKDSDKDTGPVVTKERRTNDTPNPPKDVPISTENSDMDPDLTQSPSPGLTEEIPFDVVPNIVTGVPPDGNIGERPFEGFLNITHDSLSEDKILEETPKVPPNSLEGDQLLESIENLTPGANLPIEYVLGKTYDAFLERTYEFSSLDRDDSDKQIPHGVPKNRLSARSSEAVAVLLKMSNPIITDNKYQLSSEGTYFIHPDSEYQVLLDGSYYLPPGERDYIPPDGTYQVLLDGSYYVPSRASTDRSFVQEPAAFKPTFGYIRKYKKEDPTGDELKTLSYLQSRQIFELFSFMLSHLLAKCPEEPLKLFDELLDQCIDFRDQNGKPPLQFEEPHIEAVYGALDPFEQGDINYLQYQTGMKTMGIKKFSMMPTTTKRGTIGKQVFLNEAKTTQTKELLNLLKTRGRFTEDGEGEGTAAIGQQDATVTLWPKEAEGGDAAATITSSYSVRSDSGDSGNRECYKHCEDSDYDKKMLEDMYRC